MKHLGREMRPPGFQWPQDEDPRLVIEREFGEWIAEIAEIKSLFQKNVYDNAKADQTDFCHHRFFLHTLLAEGSRLVVNLHILNKGADQGSWPREDQELAKGIEARLLDLSEIVFKWHGPPELQADIPESFRKGMASVDSGNVADFKIPGE
jgi:hypothetical protein